MDNQESLEILRNSYQKEVERLEQIIDELKQTLQDTKIIYQLLIDEKEQRIQDFRQQVTDLKKQRDDANQQVNQHFDLRGATIGGGIAAKDYTGDVIKIIEQLLKSDEIDKKVFKTLLQQLIDKLEQDND